jgi:hypothetical protein
VDRRYELLAIGLLIFSALLTVWLGVLGPTNTTTWKEWQPLMASVLAIGGALIVYRGAKLAYSAAMAKVDLDREVHARESARLTLGVCIRLEFSLRQLLYEVREQFALVPDWDRQREFTVYTKDFNLTMQPKLDEAWANLDRLPRRLSLTISDIRGGYFDFETFIRINPNAQWTYGVFTREPPETVQPRDILKTMERNCIAALDHSHALAVDLSKLYPPAKMMSLIFLAAASFGRARRNGSRRW